MGISLNPQISFGDRNTKIGFEDGGNVVRVSDVSSLDHPEPTERADGGGIHLEYGLSVPEDDMGRCHTYSHEIFVRF
ncbi:hypothetical protein DFP73DRAFT_602001 [Morchella snyderi]|nr:hypothetical protein DFP73DRAFT_602012 [Morchella snyderi]KAI5836691.1 hypothetical protein DFP73DRAFT_602013 [Morchella snyderi]KAI5836701.1 hypothetical protein DFP73DRAFT_602001 [Morchella snyderi]